MAIIDLNLNALDILSSPKWTDVSYWGLKVSSQNYPVAVEVTRILRDLYPSAKIIWGGELPTLLPDQAGQHADTIVSGRIESISESLATDMALDELKPIYIAKKAADFVEPNWSLIEKFGRYKTFMGVPIETSRDA